MPSFTEGQALADSLSPPRSLDDFRRAGAELLAAGAPLVAYDTLSDGLDLFPGDVRLRQLLALALARTGASRSANAILVGLARQQPDEETLGLLARTHKDLWAEAGDPRERAYHLQQAHEHYSSAHRVSGGYWTGINAATTALLLGAREQAAVLARNVRATCGRIPLEDASTDDRYWILATLGEAALILGDASEARDRYAEAASLGRRRFGALATTRRNARLILRQLDTTDDRIEESLRVPRVAVFTGHLIDAPNRDVPRFPPVLEAAVGAAIRARLAALDVGFGFASAASGGDILFHESLLDLGGEVHVVLPYERDQFLVDSVAITRTGEWTSRFTRVLDRATDVVTASTDRMASGQMSYEYAFLLLDGMAGLRADELDTDLLQMALWDGRPGDGPGGTASGVAYWRRMGRPVEILDLAQLARGESYTLTPPTSEPTIDDVTRRAAAPARASSFEPRIVGVLFADARGFSTLTEDQIRAFVEHFLGTVAEEVARSPRAPIVKNTWGDGLYFVFEHVRDAGEFAIGLSETIRSVDWSARNLPKSLGLRIGLHAGPAYACLDPVTGRTNYLGAHVSRAARIEPITPPGQAYASRAFAALARAEGVVAFQCEYVGQTALAKGYGTYPLYVVKRGRSSLP